MDNRNLYDIDLKEAVISEEGMYFIGLNFCFSARNSEIILRNTTNSYDIKLPSYQTVVNGKITNSISAFSYFSINDRLYLEIYYVPSSVFGSNGKTVSWLMFKYETDEYLYATTKGGSSTVAFDSVNYYQIREMKGIERQGAKKFRIKKQGLYYINIGVSAIGLAFRMICMVNTKIIMESGILREVNFNSDVVSKAFVYHFKKNDEFLCKVIYGELRNFEASSLTIIRLKVSRHHPIISIATETDYLGSGSYDPIPFSKVFANEGNCWDSSAKEYNIFIPGIYFMYIGVGSVDNREVYVQIYVNQLVFATLERSETSRKFDIVSRTLLVRLNMEDKIRFATRPTSGYKCTDYTTSFTMFFVST